MKKRGQSSGGDVLRKAETERIRTDLERMIGEHFDAAQDRVDEVARTHFTRLSPVLRRHARNLRDVPRDLLALPRSLLRLGLWPVRRLTGFGKAGRGRTGSAPVSGKTAEMERILAEELLDLPGLERKLRAYRKRRVGDLERELEAVAGRVPAARRDQFRKELRKELEKLTIPSEGAREAVMFVLAGIVGRAVSDKVVFGSAIGGGSAVAASIYVSQLSWFEVIWAKVFGIPAWVGWAGAAGGLLTVCLAAPLVAPVLELGVNRLRARRMLRGVVARARENLARRRGPDAVNLAGSMAVYMQALPDVVQVAREVALRLL